MVELAAALRSRRRELGLTQAELADLSGVSERSVRALEAGKETARIDTLVAVAESLGLRLTTVPRR